MLFIAKIHKKKNIAKRLPGLKSAILGILQELLFCSSCCCHCFLCFGLWCKGTAQIVKKNFICYCFLIFFFVLGARALVRSLWSRSRSCGCAPAMVLPSWWSLVFLCSVVLLSFRWWSLWSLCSFALVASCAILLTSAKWEYIRTHAHTHTRAIIFRPAIFSLCTGIFSPEIFGCLIAIFRYLIAIFIKESKIIFGY